MKSFVRALGLLALSATTVLAQTNLIQTTGNVGIGTTSPGFTLEVEGSFKGGGRARVEISRTAFGNQGDTVSIGSFSNDAVGKNIRIYLKAHNGGVIDVHTYEINAVAYIGHSTSWLEVPLNQNSISYLGEAGYAIDVYRPNIWSTSDPLYLRVRTKRPVGTGVVQLVVEYDDDVVFTQLHDNGTVSTLFSSSSSPSSGPVDGYYGSTEWMFPISNGQSWSNANGLGLFIKNSGNVGIGTTAPGSKLEIAGVDPIVRVHNTNDTSGGFMGDTYGVTQIGRYNPSGGQYGTIAAGQARSMLGMDANGRVGTLANNFGNPIWRNILDDGNGNVGIGTTNPTHKLAVNGTIKAKEVIVETTGWSDYVFADDYALAPLAEVEAHIKEHKHLPGIPSAAQVSEQGVSVGDMQARLLAKIEELTLHVIAQEKRATGQEKEIAALRAQVSASHTTIP